MMTDESCIIELEKLQKDKVKDKIKRKIKSRIKDSNDINSIIENIEVDFSDHGKYENLTCEMLYKHLKIGKMVSQLALNSFKEDEYQFEQPFPKENSCETYREYYEIIKQKNVDENFLIDRISYYITIFSLLSYKEFNENCKWCNSPLSKNMLKCSICDISVFDEAKFENSKRKPELCSYCDNETINGICNVCGDDSKTLKKNLQKNNKGDEDQSIKMRSTSSKISNRHKIKSNISSHWTCNVCTYNQNNNDNINCETCMSSKFATINSCVFESSYEASNESSNEASNESSNEASNENEIDSLEHVENIFNKPDVNPADDKDKWTCSQCTFSNKTTVDFCEICLTPNINKIGTVDDFELPEETWCCKRCGENNSFEHYKCKRCRLQAEFFNKWRCEQCSYYNDEVAIRCGACEIRNPYLIKCDRCSKTLIHKKHGKICKQCSTLTERCTNKENPAYQDNKNTQSETSKRNQRVKVNVNQFTGKKGKDSTDDRKIDCGNTGSLTIYKTQSERSKREQRREKINEHQIKFNNNGSQFAGKKAKDSTDDRKMIVEKTGSLTIYKTQSEPSESNNSRSKGDKKSEERNENQIKLKNLISQNIERDVKVSTNDIKSDGNLNIYNIDKTQSEISESDNSLSKGDQNREKLNKNPIKLNENIPQNDKIKNKNATVDATNKMNSKQCRNCKSKSCSNNQYWCDKCENLQWFCQNEACDGINFKNEHCKQCKAKKGSKFTNCNNFCVMKDGKEVKMWQCGFCLQFVAGTLSKCDKCLNHRELGCYKNCKCNWNNLNIREKCDKCGADLMKNVTV